MGGGSIADPKKRLTDPLTIFKPTDTSTKGIFDPTVKGGVAQQAGLIPTLIPQTELAIEHTKEDIGIFGPGDKPKAPEIPELEGMTPADITLQAQAAREAERRKSMAKRGRQSTIVTGPLGIQSAALTTKRGL